MLDEVTQIKCSLSRIHRFDFCEKEFLLLILHTRDRSLSLIVVYLMLASKQEIPLYINSLLTFQTFLSFTSFSNETKCKISCLHMRLELPRVTRSQLAQVCN